LDAESVVETGFLAMDERGDALRRISCDGFVEEFGGDEVGFDLVADLLEETLGQVPGGGVVGVGEENGAETHAAADSFFKGANAFDGEAAVTGEGAVGVDGAEVLEQRVVAAGDGAKTVAKGRGGHIGESRVPKGALWVP